MKKHNVEYWTDYVTNGLEALGNVQRAGYIHIGKGLWELHGPKGLKKGQPWKTHPRAYGLDKFIDFCHRIWPLMSKTCIYQYMKAYEAAEPLGRDEKGESAMADSARKTTGSIVIGLPESERVIRPLTALKTDADKQRAWRIANENKTGERVTARDTEQAVKDVKELTAEQYHKDKQMIKEIGQEMKSEKELHQYATEGISTKDAYLKIHASWTALIKDEDDERAIDKLANMYVEYLSNKYTITG